MFLKFLCCHYKCKNVLTTKHTPVTASSLFQPLVNHCLSRNVPRLSAISSDLLHVLDHFFQSIFKSCIGPTVPESTICCTKYF